MSNGLTATGGMSPTGLSAQIPVVPGTASDGGDLWAAVAFLSRRKGHVLLGFVLVVIAGVLYYLAAPRTYESTSQLLLMNQARHDPVMNMVDASRAVAEKAEAEILTQSAIIASPLIIKDAIKVAKLDELAAFSESEDILEDITENLRIRLVRVRDGKSEIVQASYRGPDAETTKTVLQAILDSYDRFLEKARTTVSSSVTDLIKDSREDLMRKLTAKEKDYRKFRDSAPLLYKNDKGLNPYEARLERIENDRTGLLLKRSESAARLKSINDALANNAQPGELLMIIESTASKTTGGSDNAFSEYGDKLLKLLLELKTLQQKHGDDHPAVDAKLSEIILTQSFYLAGSETLTEEQIKDQKKALKENRIRVDFVNVYRNALKHDLNRIESQIAELEDQYKKESVEGKKIEEAVFEDGVFQKDIARLESLLDGVVRNVEEISLMKAYGGYTCQQLASPELGEVVWPWGLYVGLMSVAGGLLFGGLLAYLVDTADRAFRNPMEIAQALQIPVLGHIPMLERVIRTIPRTDSPIVRSVVAFHKPRAVESEAYRGLRTALFFNTAQGSQRVVAVTSPYASDGKSTTSANLAITMAQSGKRVIIVDADLRRPQVHEIFGTHHPHGIASIINGEAELADAIVETPCPNLSVIQFGTVPENSDDIKLPKNPAELLHAAAFADLLDTLKQDYDYVIVDCPPLLPVNDSRIVGALVDGVILVMQVTKSGRSGAEHAVHMLRSVGATLLGVVVNRVQLDSRTGYGAMYSYDYGYGYGYGNSELYQSYRRYGGGYRSRLDPDSDYEPVTRPVAVSSAGNGSSSKKLKG